MICGYNRMVDCESRKNCLRCGWNPKVSARRVAAVSQRLADEKCAMKTIILPKDGDVWSYHV